MNTQLQVCLAYVDAQREAARVPREGDGLLKYAMHSYSDKAREAGSTGGRERASAKSLGPLVANASGRGSPQAVGRQNPSPTMATSTVPDGQGPDAPGGAFDHVVDGKMIGRFASSRFRREWGFRGS